ncbi:MAG: hypothetical protein ABH950_02200 [Candidatus Altiarchaeota archaeon]
MAKVSEVMVGKKEETDKAIASQTETSTFDEADKQARHEAEPGKLLKAKLKVITVGGKKYEILNENRISARIFESIAARSAIIMNALDRAKRDSFDKETSGKETPAYKHNVILGPDELGHNLKASITVFSNGIVVQTLREI